MLCLCSLGRCLILLVSNLDMSETGWPGGVLSPVLFALYTDVLIRSLRNAGFGCHLLNEFYCCILYRNRNYENEKNVIRFHLLMCHVIPRMCNANFDNMEILLSPQYLWGDLS